MEQHKKEPMNTTQCNAIIRVNVSERVEDTEVDKTVSQVEVQEHESKLAVVVDKNNFIASSMEIHLLY